MAQRIVFAAAIAGWVGLASPTPAAASCLIYVTPIANLAEVENPATSVFVLRDGTRTILTIEPTYDGPVTDLAMVIPVPQAIAREDIRTISGSHFRRIDRRTAPQAVHQWPGCPLPGRLRGAGRGRAVAQAPGADDGVELLEQWEVDEYDVSLLGAADSAGLASYLRARALALPPRADDVLRGYVETGHRFVFIRVNVNRAHEVGGHAVLSPIQLTYDSDELTIPVRLGTLHSPGTQDLLLYVLASNGRYEVANRENVIAPTFARLRGDYEGGFAAFYRGLMDHLFREHPGAAVTEYAKGLEGWGANPVDVYHFGLDRYAERGPGGSRVCTRKSHRWTLTRIRHRYARDLQDDLVLRQAEPLRRPIPWSSVRVMEENYFAVFFPVIHEPARCPGQAERLRIGRAWATATSEALWSSDRAVWPGEVLLDPVLGIEPGSAPPPEPPEVVVPPPPAAIAPEAQDAVDEPARAPAAQVRPSEGCGCHLTAPRRGLATAWGAAALALVIGRRTRRGVRRSRSVWRPKRREGGAEGSRRLR